ncbi:sigma-70 family RNA polymerase sigma factor [Desulfosporosinus fructosivorans]|uniref:Sigma-70 family RNA polymerase sigma factor n=1 Tax=Desulfosporosinus fructosivorans TaxID=2018669 RepID=A0A4Z0QXR2_9FIRM|nr:sigma-70 family RNA polymerase sigma factor [Desulfosporosinus fructosivorans]TGE35210.1 sigma-70 family RNA polymerase sigma factor [Desulfosporosinus fructosivorans]
MEQEIIEMVKRAKAGDKEILINLIMRQKQDYYRLAYVYMKNHDDALDIMEDMILRVYENIKKLKDEHAFYSWSKTILVNCCKNNLRRNSKVLFLNDVPEGSYDEAFGVKEDQIILESHWSRLNQKYQEVLKLRYYLDMDYESIATVLKIPLGTVKSRIHTGMQKLKLSMGVGNG